MGRTDFTKGSVTKSLLSFFFSMLLANVLQQFYSFADMVMIGKGLGDTAVAAVGNFTTFSFLITGFIMGVTNGFSVILSQAYGEKDFATFRRAAASSVMLSVVSALYLTGIGLWCLRPVLRIMQTDQMLIGDCLSFTVDVTPYTRLVDNYGGKSRTIDLTVEKKELRSVTINGKQYTNIKANDNGSFTVADYKATADDCREGEIRLTVDALITYSYDLNVKAPARQTAASPCGSDP